MAEKIVFNLPPTAKVIQRGATAQSQLTDWRFEKPGIECATTLLQGKW